jgi:electron transfer flavoprotein beta subunit
LGVELKPKVEVVAWDMPQERQAGVMVDSVESLFDKLKNEAKVI